MWVKETLDRRLSWTIFDAVPHTLYEIQLQAKDEFDGVMSDWTDTVFGMAWSNNDILIGIYLYICKNKSDKLVFFHFN